MDQITPTTKPVAADRAPPRPADLIAIRKTCDTEGTGLSHFVLMDKEVSK